jgi:broad specificity phosphatase PhoE
VTKTISVHLVRHAKAGSRRAWAGDDERRPLSKRGRTQARALAKRLAGDHVTRIVSSPFVRCVETVAPLGERIGVEVETAEALAEGAGLADALRLFEKCTSETSVLCTHGDVLGVLLTHFAHQGVELDTDRLEKASVWTLDVVEGEVRAARYLAPPIST